MSNQLFSRNLKLAKWFTGQSNMSEPSHQHKEAHSYHHVVLTQPSSGYEHHHVRKRSHVLQYTTLGVGGLAVVSLVWWLNNSDAFYQDNQHLSLQENIANTLSQIPQSLGQTPSSETPPATAPQTETVTPSTEQPAAVTASTPSWSPWLYLNVQPGDTLMVIFERNRLSADDMYQILEVAEYADNLHSLYPNQEMRIKRDASNGVEEIFAALDLNTELHIFRNDAGFGGEIMQFNEQSGRMQVVTDPKILAEFGGETVAVPKVQLSEVAPKVEKAETTPKITVSTKAPVKLTEAEVTKVNKDEKAAKAAQAKEAEARKLAIQEAAKEKRLKAIAETTAKKTARETAIKDAIAKKEAAQKAAKLAAAEEATTKKSAVTSNANANAEESAARKAARIAAAEEAAARKAARIAAAEETAARRAEQQAAAEERAAAKRAEQQAIAEERASRRAEQQAAAEERAAAKRAEQQAAAEERAAEQQRVQLQLAKQQQAQRQAQERQAAQQAAQAAAARQVAAIAPQRVVRQEVNSVVNSVRQSFTQAPRQMSSLPIPSPVESPRPVAKRRTAASNVGTTVFDDVDSRYTSSSDPKLSKVLDSARDLIGTPYRFGGTTPKGFDCSGFVRYNARVAGAELPRTAREQYSATKAVDKEELRPGDLVFFNTRGRGVGHVGIYVGDNKFIHAPNRRKDVEVTSMEDKYYKQRYVRGGRF